MFPVLLLFDAGTVHCVWFGYMTRSLVLYHIAHTPVTSFTSLLLNFKWVKPSPVKVGDHLTVLSCL